MRFGEREPMEPRRCEACGEGFHPRAQNPSRHYCSARACQRERAGAGSARSAGSDPDYRDIRPAPSSTGASVTPSTGANTAATSEYVEATATPSAGVTARGCREPPAADDLQRWTPQRDFPCASGTYRLQPVDASGIAKMDAWDGRIGSCPQRVRDI